MTLPDVTVTTAGVIRRDTSTMLVTVATFPAAVVEAVTSSSVNQ